MIFKKAEPNPNTLGMFLAKQMKLRELSNRALATGAGVSDSVIRNLLQHGISKDAKDPDPRTLRSVADFLGINSLYLFQLAGYIPPDPDGNSVAADFLADIFDRLPPLKQDVVLSVIQGLVENGIDKIDVEAMREGIDRFHPSPYIDDFPSALRQAANTLIVNSGITNAKDMTAENLKPDLEVLPQETLGKLWKSDHKKILALARSKLNLEYDPTMVDIADRDEDEINE